MSTDVAAGLIGKRLTITVRSSGDKPVVVDNLRIWRQPALPTRAMLSKPNGIDGPDRVDAGILGFEAFTDHWHVPLPVIAVRDDSPAAKAGLKAGDIIIGINGVPLKASSCAAGFEWFDDGHEATLGRAVLAALQGSDDVTATTPSGQIGLDVIRDGTRDTITIRLPVRGSFGAGNATFPYGDDLSKQMTEDVIEWIVREQKPDGRWATDGNDTIQTPLAAMALLATHDRRHAAAIKKAADWIMKKFHGPEEFGNLAYWPAGYAGTFLCEYLLATGDARVMPWIRRTLNWIATGYFPSKWTVPILGHGPGGLPYEEKSLIICTAHVLVFEALARRCGVTKNESDIRGTVWPFLRLAWANPEDGGNGSIGYNPSYKDGAEFWARSGLIGIEETLVDEKNDDAHAMRASIEMVMRKRHAWMRSAHAYGLPGAAWGLCGLRALSAEGFAEVMRKWRWSFALAWEPGYGLRYSTPHMGSPYMGEEGIINTAMGMMLAAARGPAGDGSKPGLHLVGATDRNWLDVSKLPVSVSDVRIVRDAKGMVTMESVVPGADIHYTTDGSVPDRRSAAYSKPVKQPGACVIHARVINSDDEEGPVAVAVFGNADTGRWKVKADTEHPGLGADLAIDGDLTTFWQTKFREGVPDAHPHALTIDMRSSGPLMGVRYWPRQDGGYRGTVVDYAVTVSRDGRRWPDEPTATGSLEHDFGRHAAKEIVFDRVVEAAAIRFESRSALDSGWCASAAEIVPLEPQPTISINGGSATITSPDGFIARYTVNGSMPDARSPQASGPVSVPQGGLVIARCYAARFEGPPVAAVRGARK